MAGAKRLHCCFLGCKPAGEMWHWIPATLRVCDFTCRKNSVDESIAVARDNCLDPLELGRIHSEADDVHTIR